MPLPKLKPRGDRCPLCQSNRHLDRAKVWASDTCDPSSSMQIYICGDCQFAWQWPLRRAASDSQAFFEAAYSEATPGSYFDKRRKARIARLEYQYMREFFGAPGKLLDVGAGDGTFCEIAHADGWDVLGLDPAITATVEFDGLRLRQGTIDDLSEDQFDAVTMWDVVEHVDDPLSLLQAARSKLKPGGYLFVETGNYLSFNRLAQNGRWWAYQLDHRWYFNPHVLSKIVALAGFPDPVICPRMLRPEWRNSSWSALINHLKLIARGRPIKDHIELAQTARSGLGELDIFAIAAEYR